jgi:predicted nucleic acid-binding Zn ribbon protein
MTSPARRSFERKMAAKAGHVVRPGALPKAANGPAATAYQLKLVALGEDLRRLSNTQSLETKIELKRG